MIDGIKISVSMDAVLKRMENMLKFTRLKGVAVESSAILEKLYRKYTPVSKDPNQPSPGKLRAGWKGEVETDEPHAKLKILIRNIDPRAAKIWPLLQSGTKRHAIQAVHAKVLAFQFASGDQFFGPGVRHPGAKKSVDKVAMDREVQTELTRLKKRIAEALASEKTVVGPA